MSYGDKGLSWFYIIRVLTPKKPTTREENIATIGGKEFACKRMAIVRRRVELEDLVESPEEDLSPVS